MPTDEHIKVYDEHRQWLEAELKSCLGYFMRMDTQMERWFGGGSQLAESDFYNIWETEMDKLETSLEKAQIRIEQGERGNTGVGLDRRSGSDIKKIQKHFWIQSALVEAMTAEPDNVDSPPRPRIWELNYLRCEQWGVTGAARKNIVEPNDPYAEDLNKVVDFFDPIKVSLSVDIILADVPVLLQRILTSGRVHFQTHTTRISKMLLQNKNNSLEIPSVFKITRDGKEIEVGYGQNMDETLLSMKNCKILPAVIPVVPDKTLDFGARTQGDTKTIPTQEELLAGILGATYAGGEVYPFEEPPVRLELFLVVRDYNFARVKSIMDSLNSKETKKK